MSLWAISELTFTWNKQFCKQKLCISKNHQVCPQLPNYAMILSEKRHGDLIVHVLDLWNQHSNAEWADWHIPITMEFFCFQNIICSMISKMVITISLMHNKWYSDKLEIAGATKKYFFQSLPCHFCFQSYDVVLENYLNWFLANTWIIDSTCHLPGTHMKFLVHQGTHDRHNWALTLSSSCESAPVFDH